MQYWMNDRYMKYAADRHTAQKWCISADEMYSMICVIICRMGRGSFWSWFDVNRPIFHEDMRFFVPSDIDLWPKFALIQRYDNDKLEVSMAFLFRVNRRHRTDGQKNVVQHLSLIRLFRGGGKIAENSVSRVTRKDFFQVKSSQSL